ncbi:FAD-linked oxidase, partial [Bacillus thuringiensis]
AVENISPNKTAYFHRKAIIAQEYITSWCKCQDKHVHFRLFKHVQNQSFSLLK